jgi:hypothetical protein
VDSAPWGEAIDVDVLIHGHNRPLVGFGNHNGNIRAPNHPVDRVSNEACPS